MVILVDRGTLGAAEVFATVLRQKEKAELVGERTFGHAGRQGTAELSNGGRLLFTEAFYTGPDKKPLNEALKPDLLVDERSRTYLEKDMPMGELILRAASAACWARSPRPRPPGRLKNRPEAGPHPGPPFNSRSCMVRRSRPRRPRSGGIWLFLLGLLVGAGVLYLFTRPRLRSPEPPREDAGTPARPPRERPRGVPRSASARLGPRRAYARDAGEGATTVPSGRPARRPRGPGDRRPRDEPSIPASARGAGRAGHLCRAALRGADAEVVAELRQRGAEILLHLPMEPKNGEDPGPGALLQGMDDDELRAADAGRPCGPCPEPWE